MKKNFITKQFARFRYFVNRVSVFFALANFISLIVIMLTGLGMQLNWYWLVIIYVGFIFFGLLGVYVLERLGVWRIDLFQTWKMVASELFKQKSEYNAVMIELMRRKTVKELMVIKEELERRWE